MNDKFTVRKYLGCVMKFCVITPHTGCFHQLRKHLAHIFHHIIGDRPHGCNKQNKLWKEKFGMTTMLLHARELAFEHPVSGQTVDIEAEFNPEFRRVTYILKLKYTALDSSIPIQKTLLA